MAVAEQGKLNLRQTKFVAAYIATGNAAEAARRAGYTGDARRTGDRLLTNRDISRQVEAARRRIEKKGIADRQEALEFATSVMRDADESTRDRLEAMARLCRLEGWDKAQADGAPVQVAAGVQVFMQTAATGDPVQQAEFWQMVHAMRLRRHKLLEEDPCREK